MSNRTLNGGMVVAALAAAFRAAAEDAETAEVELPEPDLGAVTGYAFGESRLALTAVHELVTDTLKKDEKEQQQLADELEDLLDEDGTTPDAKLFICRELARIATGRNVRGIAKLMDEPETVDIARYALHPIPGDAVEKELAKKVRKADDALRIAIFNTFGARGNAAGRDTLKKYADDKNPDVAAAAKAALARLG